MINTILVDHDAQSLAFIEQQLNAFCPQLSISGVATSSCEACQLIESITPALAIIAVEMPKFNGFQIHDNFSSTTLETIFLAQSTEYAVEAVKYQVSGYVLKPVQLDALLDAVGTAQSRIEEKARRLKKQNGHSLSQSTRPPGNLIGIPSLKGFDFVAVEDIIRCESLQKCTRIVTRERSDLLSSYNIGEFIKQLEPHGFFSPHKSHLINLAHLKQYYKEGTIKMRDNSFVPISRRKKSMFLKMMMIYR